MSLKLIKRGRVYYVRGTVRGIRCYETCGTSEPEQAKAYRAKREAELYERALFGARAVVSFKSAALSYLDFEARSERTKDYVNRLVEHFGTAKLATIDQAAADKAVTAIVGDDAAPATKIRTVYTPLTSVLMHAADRQWCDRPKFRRPSVPKSRTPWLAPEDALRLVDAAAPHLRPLLHFILCTGARLSEALDLDWSDVDLPAAKVIFRETKNGRDRAAALPEAAILTVANLPGRAGKVFRRDDGDPYADRERQEGGQIKTAWRTACKRAGLGRERGEVFLPSITPHGLRHTWATWFYGLTRDPLLLKTEGGWETIAMVERYAHLMPSELVPEINRVWGASHPRIGTLPGAQIAREQRA